MSHKVFISFKCSTIDVFFTILLSNAKIFLNLIQRKFFRPIMKADFQLVMYERVQFCCSANLTKNSKKIFSLVEIQVDAVSKFTRNAKKGELDEHVRPICFPICANFWPKRRFAQTLGILMLFYAFLRIFLC